MSANQPKAFAFKKSALAAKADKIWSESKFSGYFKITNNIFR